MTRVIGQESIGLAPAIRSLAEEVIDESTGIFLVDVVVRGRTGSRVLEVYVDSEAGIDVSQLGKISRGLALRVESEDLVKGKYHLNVSSPGPDRALLQPRQYVKHVGRMLELAVSEEGGTGYTVKGKLMSVDDTGIELELERKETAFVAYKQVESGKILLPW